MATHLAAAGEAVDGVVLFGYPLHPAKKPEKLRAAHLSTIRAPSLFVQGSRDALCDLGLLRPVVAAMSGRAELAVIEGADHSLARPLRSGATLENTAVDVARLVDDWLARRVAARARSGAG